jgi:hypothetical protein
VFDGPNCSFMGPFFPAENFVFRAWNGPNERGLGQMPPRSAPPVTPASTRPTFYGALADAPNTFASSAAARRVRRMPTTTGAMRLRRRRGSCPSPTTGPRPTCSSRIPGNLSAQNFVPSTIAVGTGHRHSNARASGSCARNGQSGHGLRVSSQLFG